MIYFLAFFWGIFFALFLQYTPLGKWLAARRTWLTVVIGVGGDLLLLALALPVDVLLPVVGVVAASAVGIVVRSLWNEQQETETAVRYAKETQK